MTPVQVNVDIDDKGHGVDIAIRCDKAMHVAQYIEILEGVITSMKRTYGPAIVDFEALKKSGKLVPIR